ncbi:MAG: hypothetical protein NVSMB67_10840 [Flavisolibacter sp.]
MKKIFPFITLAFLIVTFRSFSQNQHPVLNHIAIYVTDLKTSTNFYQNIIQLDTIPEPFHDHKHTWFAIGPVGHLHVIEGAKKAEAHEKNVHLCFSVASIAAFIANLDKGHIEFEDWLGHKNIPTNRVDGVKQIYFKDPDGYWIEINDAKN